MNDPTRAKSTALAPLNDASPRPLVNTLLKLRKRTPTAGRLVRLASDPLYTVAGTLLTGSPVGGLVMLVGAMGARWLNDAADDATDKSKQVRIDRVETLKAQLESYRNELDWMHTVAEDLSISCRQALNMHVQRFMESRHLANDKTRVTFFVPSVDGQTLKIAARHSTNASWSEYNTRTYPANAGFVGRAWETGRHEVSQLPKPDDNWDEYLKAQGDCGYSVEQITALTMHSRCYYCYRVGRRLRDEPGGIVVIESTSAQISNISQIRKELVDDPGSEVTLLFQGMLRPAEHLIRLDRVDAFGSEWEFERDGDD